MIGEMIFGAIGGMKIHTSLFFDFDFSKNPVDRDACPPPPPALVIMHLCASKLPNFKRICLKLMSSGLLCCVV
jgi:hypothetical protein